MAHGAGNDPGQAPRRLRASVYRTRTRRLRWRRRTLGAGLIAIIAIAAVLGTTNVLGTLAQPSANLTSLSNPGPADTLIYAADGSLLADLQPQSGMHYDATLEQMGTWLPKATVAIEDSNYWSEPGVDPVGVVRAALANAQAGEVVEGASTIPMQVVKLRLQSNEPDGFGKKLQQAVLAVQLEHVYDRQQILQMYLNAVPYANDAQGAAAASQNYFRKTPAQLDLAEASMLAGIPQSPYYNNPLTNWTQAKRRQQQVLTAMVGSHYVTAAQASAAYAEDLQTELQTPPPSVRAAPAFVSWVVRDLVGRYGEDTTYGGGLRVTTSLNPTLQSQAEQSVQQQVAGNTYRNLHQGAGVAIDPGTGEVLAMVGSASPDQPGGQYNYAADVPRNPGSSFKIFTYTAAIQSKKYTMTTPLADAPVTVSMPGFDTYQPRNYESNSYPACVVQTCLGNSLNIPAVEAELGTGIPDVLQTARAMGAPPYVSHGSGSYTQNDPASSFGPSLTLGGYGETPLQMASGTATLAAGGVYHPPTGIVKVARADGSSVYAYAPAATAKQVVDPKVAYIMQAMLSNDANRSMIFGTGSALTLPGRQVAAKTGTTDSFTDAWTVGFTPRLASAFWFGNPDFSPMQSGWDAIYAAAPAWQRFMTGATSALGEPASDWYTPPAGLEQAGSGVWLLPGTSAGQSAPPLPSWVTFSPSVGSGQSLGRGATGRTSTGRGAAPFG